MLSGCAAAQAQVCFRAPTQVVGILTLRLAAAHQPGRHCWLRSPFGQAASSFTACARSVSQVECRASCAVPLMLVRVEEESVSRVRALVLLRAASLSRPAPGHACGGWTEVDITALVMHCCRQMTTCAIGCPAPCPQPQPTPAPAQRTQAHQACLTPVGAQDALLTIRPLCALPVSRLKRL